MLQVTLVIGLPASGKSAFLEDFAREGIPVFDDFMKGLPTHSAFPACLHLGQIERHLRHGRDIVLADVRLTDPEFHSSVVSGLRSVVPDLQIRTICFENDPEQCLANSARRANQQLEDHLRERDLIARFSARYSIAPGAEVLPVARPKR